MKLNLLIGIISVLGSVYSEKVSPGRPESLSWQNWHMIEEHGLDQYDSSSFFKLHDLKGRNRLDKTDILNMYGLLRENIGDGSGMGEHLHEKEITDDEKDYVVSRVLQLVDADGDGTISFEEWHDYTESNNELPDFGYGQGHHLDFEREYEEHHWNKYHAKDDPDVLVKHAEDIEHELIHHEHELEESHDDHPEIREVAKNYDSQIILKNIPSKYQA